VSLRSSSWITSLFMHIFLIAAFYIVLPSFSEEVVEQPRVISAEILTIAEVSNVRPQQKEITQETEKPRTQPEKTTTPTKQVKAEEVPKEPIPEKPKEEPIESTKPAEKKPEEPKKKPEKQQKKVDEDLDALLKSLDSGKKKPEKEGKGATQGERAESDSHNADSPLSLSEVDFIKQQIQKCWNVPAGARDSQNLKVRLKVKMNEDGSLKEVKVVDISRYGSDGYFRAAADSAVRAVKLCTPLKDLPANKYGGDKGWGNMEINFDPKDMIF